MKLFLLDLHRLTFRMKMKMKWEQLHSCDHHPFTQLREQSSGLETRLVARPLNKLLVERSQEGFWNCYQSRV
jgi:hypothetical protein